MSVKVPSALHLVNAKSSPSGISKAHIALGPVVGIVRTAAVESLIRRAAQALARDFARDRVVAMYGAPG